VGPWVAGRLLLFDLGYFKWQLFELAPARWTG